MSSNNIKSEMLESTPEFSVASLAENGHVVHLYYVIITQYGKPLLES